MTSSTLTSSEIASHITKKLGEGTPVLDPFPYLVTDDVLPNDVFRRFVADLPAVDELTPMSAIGLRNVSRYEKHRTALMGDVRRRSDPEVWAALERAVLDPSIERVLRGMFRPSVPTASDERDLIREVRLDCGVAGAYLEPHTDSPIVLMKTLIYLSAEGDDPSTDTVLFAPKDVEARRQRLGSDDFTVDSYAHESVDDHEPVARVRFRPNRMWTFFRTPNSLHGLDPLADHVAPRFVLVGHYKFVLAQP